jgi:hypothetical protein
VVVLNKIAPETPRATLLLPLSTVIVPPVLLLDWPDLKLKSFPDPLLPLPTTIVIDPARPDDAVPETTDIVPVLPWADVPLLNIIEPLANEPLSNV